MAILTAALHPLGAMIHVAVSPRTQLGDTAAQPVRFIAAIIDTGANTSLVNRSILQALGIKTDRYGRVLTASGGGAVKAEIYEVAFRLHHAGKDTVYERVLDVYGTDMTTHGIDALLGQDFLSQCLFIYDGAAGRYTLSF